MRQHDHRRIGMREMFRRTIRVGAAADVAGFSGDRWMAADAAEAVARMPIGEPARIGEEGAFMVRQQRTDVAQIGEFHRLRCRDHLERRRMLRQVDRKICDAFAEPEQHCRLVDVGAGDGCQGVAAE